MAKVNKVKWFENTETGAEVFCNASDEDAIERITDNGFTEKKQAGVRKVKPKPAAKAASTTKEAVTKVEQPKVPAVPKM